MQKLVEGVLSVCSRLTEDHRACDVIDGLSVPVDVLSVGFHVQLLEMGRESGEGLGIGEDGCCGIIQHGAHVETVHCVQEGAVLLYVGISCQDVLFMGSLQDFFEYRVAEGDGEHYSSHCTGGGVASADVVVDEE